MTQCESRPVSCGVGTTETVWDPAAVISTVHSAVTSVALKSQEATLSVVCCALQKQEARIPRLRAEVTKFVHQSGQRYQHQLHLMAQDRSRKEVETNSLKDEAQRLRNQVSDHASREALLQRSVEERDATIRSLNAQIHLLTETVSRLSQALAEPRTPFQLHVEAAEPERERSVRSASQQKLAELDAVSLYRECVALLSDEGEE